MDVSQRIKFSLLIEPKISDASLFVFRGFAGEEAFKALENNPALVLQ